MGWYVVGLVDLLKYLPKSHPQYSTMISILGNIAEGIKNAQDPSTGLWYQVTDKPTLAGNLIESSGSGLFIYALKTAVDYGIIDKSYLAVAQKGWTGFKTKITLDAGGLPVINGFVGATSAGVLTDYLAAPLVSCPTNLAPHGYCAALYAASAMELQTVPKYRLTVSIVGQGSVSNPTGEMFLDSGSTVTLTATPNSGYHLSQWSGDASATATTAAITMNAEKNITATFAQGASIIKPFGNKTGQAFFNYSLRGKTISFTLASSEKIGIEIYNSNGCKVKTVAEGIFQTGNHAIDLKLNGMPTGTYFIKVIHRISVNAAMISLLK
jgi:flagellar hook assembly protein FlgD